MSKGFKNALKLICFTAIVASAYKLGNYVEGKKSKNPPKEDFDVFPEKNIIKENEDIPLKDDSSEMPFSQEEPSGGIILTPTEKEGEALEPVSEDSAAETKTEADVESEQHEENKPKISFEDYLFDEVAKTKSQLYESGYVLTYISSPITYFIYYFATSDIREKVKSISISNPFIESFRIFWYKAKSMGWNSTEYDLGTLIQTACREINAWLDKIIAYELVSTDGVKDYQFIVANKDPKNIFMTRSNLSEYLHLGAGIIKNTIDWAEIEPVSQTQMQNSTVYTYDIDEVGRAYYRREDAKLAGYPVTKMLEREIYDEIGKAMAKDSEPENEDLEPESKEEPLHKDPSVSMASKFKSIREADFEPEPVEEKNEKGTPEEAKNDKSEVEKQAKDETELAVFDFYLKFCVDRPKYGILEESTLQITKGAVWKIAKRWLKNNYNLSVSQNEFLDILRKNKVNTDTIDYMGLVYYKAFTFTDDKINEYADSLPSYASYMKNTGSEVNKSIVDVPVKTVTYDDVSEKVFNEHGFSIDAELFDCITKESKLSPVKEDENGTKLWSEEDVYKALSGYYDKFEFTSETPMFKSVISKGIVNKNGSTVSESTVSRIISKYNIPPIGKENNYMGYPKYVYPFETIKRCYLAEKNAKNN